MYKYFYPHGKDIMASLLVNVVSPNSILTVRNPAGNPGALTITPIAGGASAGSLEDYQIVVNRINSLFAVPIIEQ